MTTMKKIRKRKTKRHWYRRDPAFISTVQYCVDRNLSEKESLKLIEEHFGHLPSGRNFRRIKKILPMNNTQRLEIVNEDSASFIMETIHVLHTTENGLFKIVKDPNTSVWMKIKAFETIAKNRVVMADFYDSSPDVASFSKLIEDNANAIQKP